MPPWAQAFMSGPWYMGPPCGCCCIMGFWAGPRRLDIMVLGGLDPGGPNEGSPCWPIPAMWSNEVTDCSLSYLQLQHAIYIIIYHIN